MTDRPKISVVTPGFNSVTTIRDTIGSVLRQDYKEREHCFKAKRQAQKLFLRGQCDLVPGTWRLKPRMCVKTEFSSNAGLDKFEAWLP